MALTSTTHAPYDGQNTRLLRTLNIHQTSHVIQLNLDKPPNLFGRRKTAVELLQESKSFYVKSERVLDCKQEFPHGSRLLIRTPMLGPPTRMREHQLPLHLLVQGDRYNDQRRTNNDYLADYPAASASIDDNCTRRNKEVWYSTPPLEKRRLSIRKDNPLPFVNVTAVKRFLSRPEETVHIRKVTPKLPAKVAFSAAIPSGPLSGPAPSHQLQPTKKLKSRITFSEVIPCICQSQNQPPELPHRMSKMRASPPPPIPPKSPALNAKLRLLSQQSLQQHSLPHFKTFSPVEPNQIEPIRAEPIRFEPIRVEPIRVEPIRVEPTRVEPAKVEAHRHIQSHKPQGILHFALTVTKSPASAVTKPAAGSVNTVGIFRRVPPNKETPTSQRVESFREATRSLNLLRNHLLHKSLPDLNSTKSRRRGCFGKIRSASTDLDSCSDCSNSSSRMSRSSSVRMSSSTSAASGESSIESEAQFHRASRPRSAAGERTTTSDYASRSPSFKYETSSLVQTGEMWQLPPWDDSGVDPSADSQPVVVAETKRKVILRSKSDVGQSRFAPDLLPAIPPEFTGDVPQDLDHFFDNIGLDTNAAVVLCPPEVSGRSTPIFFSSVSSVDSCSKRRHVDNACESSDSDDKAATLQRRLLGNQPGMGEPSIVERNARIIKWLIKCRNTTSAASIPASESTGQLKWTSQQQSQPQPQPQSGAQRHVHSLYYGQSTRL